MNNRGLTLVEILIATSLVFIIGISGYYFFYRETRSPININTPPIPASPVPVPGSDDVDEMIVTDETNNNPSDKSSNLAVTPGAYTNGEHCIITLDIGEERRVSCKYIDIEFASHPNDETLKELENVIPLIEIDRSYEKYGTDTLGDKRTKYLIIFLGNNLLAFQKTKKTLETHRLLIDAKYRDVQCLVEKEFVSEKALLILKESEYNGLIPVNCTKLNFTLSSSDTSAITSVEGVLKTQGAKYSISEYGNEHTFFILYDENTTFEQFKKYLSELKNIAPSIPFDSHFVDINGGAHL